MPIGINIFETETSRAAIVGADNPDLSLHYMVTGIDDDTAVKTLVEATIPGTYAGLPLNSYRLTPQGNANWAIEARYTRRAPGEVGHQSLDFDTTGETTKVTQSLFSVLFPGPDLAEAINFNGAINVRDKGGKRQAEGVDITVPQLAFTLHRTLENPPNVTYLENLFLKTGTVNSDTVDVAIPHGAGVITINTAPGELLFLGFTGQERTIETYQVDLKFKYSPNVTGLSFGDGEDAITDVAKRGHDYLWVFYATDPDDGAGKHLIPKPIQVNVEQVYPMVTHSELFA